MARQRERERERQKYSDGWTVLHYYHGLLNKVNSIYCTALDSLLQHSGFGKRRRSYFGNVEFLVFCLLVRRFGHWTFVMSWILAS